MSEKHPVDIIFLDFSKAFDKVPHKRLITKLEALGVKEELCRWLRAFLNNRQQRLVIGDGSSGWIPVNSGVPQGSVLGPTLFKIFVNDLPASIKNICKLYANDCKIMARVDSEADIRSL